MPRDVGRAEMRGQLGLALDAGEVEPPLLDEFAHRIVGAYLALEDLAGEPPAVVVNPRRRPLQPVCGSRGALGADRLRPPDKLPLVDLLDVHAEGIDPLVRVSDRGVHAHRAAADAAERRPTQLADRQPGGHVAEHALQHRRVGDAAPGPDVGPADLVESAARREHADHARVHRVDAAEEKQRTCGRTRREHREMGERPDRIVEDREVRVAGCKAAGRAGRDIAGADRLAAALDLVARARQRGRHRGLGLVAESQHVAGNEVPAIGHGQQRHTCHARTSAESPVSY